MHGLTSRQQTVLDFVRASIAKHGYAPTIREIGEHVGIRSTNGVSDHLRALERKGYIVRKDMKSRAMLLVENGVCSHCGQALPAANGKAS